MLRSHRIGERPTGAASCGEGLEGEGDVPRGLEALLGPLLETARYDALEPGGDLRTEPRQLCRVVLQDRGHGLGGGIAPKGAPPSEHLVQHGAVREDVRSTVR